MPRYRAQIIWRSQSALPQDDFNNVLHFIADPPNAEDEITVMNQFGLAWSGEFVGTALGGPDSIPDLGQLVHTEVKRGATVHDINFYRLPTGGGNPGSPFMTYQWGFTQQQSSQDFPAEVATVLSYRASYDGVLERDEEGNRPRARRRGRMYLPVGRASTSTNYISDRVVRPYPPFRAGLRARFQAFYTALQTNEIQLGIYSRVDNQVYTPVVSQWVDNAYDTQRRRGPEHTERDEVAVTNV